jgi:hypothetical protein
MPNLELLSVLVFLLPGILSETVLNILCVREKKSDLEKIMEALVLSVPIYALYSFVTWGAPFPFDYKTLAFKPMPMLTLVVVAVAIPLAISRVQKSGKMMEWLAGHDFTSRTGRRSVWHDVFGGKNSYIVVHFKDGRRLYGWPEFYSDDPEKRLCYVVQAEWLTENEERVPVEGDGILLDVDKDVQYIEIYRKPVE